jgi:hypothetical protein
LLGLILASLPFLQFGVGAGHEPHADHSSHRGGVLQMVGDHHLEIVDDGGRLFVFVSDAQRRPLRAASARTRVDGARDAIAMDWRSDHFEVALEGPYEMLEIVVALQAGPELRAAVSRAVLLGIRPG